jgi:broad specificity phosphatase PhoE
MNKTNTTIYVIRHGQSEFNATLDLDSIDMDKEDTPEAPLTTLGKEQVASLAQELKNIHFAAIFSSDLVRAKETAEAILMERKIAVQTTKVIRERDVVRPAIKLGYKSIDEIEIWLKKELKTLDEKGKMNFSFSLELETPNEGATRLLTFIREVSVAYAGQTVAVVCHSNIMRCLLTHLGYAKFDELPRKSTQNAAYFVLESDGVDFFVKETHGIQKIQGEARGI